MTAFMITMFILHLLGTGISISDLTNKTYPYVKTKSKGEDVASLLVSLLFAIWAGVLIF